MKNILYIMWKNSISVYSLKNISFLTNVRNKRVIRKINLNFLTSWKMTSPLQKAYDLYGIWRPPMPMKSFNFLKINIFEDLLILNSLYMKYEPNITFK